MQCASLDNEALDNLRKAGSSYKYTTKFATRVSGVVVEALLVTSTVIRAKALTKVP
jgi:hypothetical protein